MSGNVTITNLGAADDSHTSVLLQLDNLSVLIDCGFSERILDAEAYYNQFESRLRDLDAILISHADLCYLGGLAYFSKRFPTVPVIATLPVANLGRLVYLEAVMHSQHLPDAPTTDQVTEIFDRVVRLRYHQSIALPSRGAPCSATPLACGNSVGAAIWRITRGNQEVLYAVDYSHKKERHLDGLASFEAIGAKPAVLVTSARSSLSVHRNKKQRDSEFTDACIKTLRSNGTVCVTTTKFCTRLLEVCLLLEQTWKSDGLSYSIYLLALQSSKLVEYAKSMLEWMGESVIRAFGNDRSNPFDFRYIRTVQSLSEIKETPNQPKVILSAMQFLGELLHSFGSLPSTLFLFPTDQLVYERLKQTGTFHWEEHRLVLLVGEELQALRRKVAFQSERKKADDAFDRLIRTRQAIETLSDEEEGLGTVSAEPQLQTVDTERDKLKRIYWTDYSFDCSNCEGNLHAVFPAPRQLPRSDEYGEPVRMEDFSELLLIRDDEQKKPKADRLAPGPMSELAPTKWESSASDLVITCRLGWIDFEGLSDGRSIKTIISRISPRNVVLCGGSPVERLYMQQFCKANDEITDRVYSVDSGVQETLACGVDVFSITLDESLLKSLCVQSHGPYELAQVAGRIEEQPDVSSRKLLPLSEAAVTDPVLIGTLRFVHLKRQIQSKGIADVSFQSGLLICPKLGISIRRQPQSSEIFLEGPVSPEYYMIRELLYSQMVVL